MAEIEETKPSESVNDAVSLFEQKIYQHNYCSPSMGEKDKELDLLMKELAVYKLQLKAKESAYMQASVKLDVYSKTLVKLSSQLKLTEADRDKYMEEWKKSRAFISMLECEYEVVTDQLVDSIEDHEKLLQILNEHSPMKEELVQLKSKLTTCEELKVDALTKAELAEESLQLEREKNEELAFQVSELNSAIFKSNLAAIDAEETRYCFFEGLEAELEVATEAVIQSHEQLEQMKMQLSLMNDLGNEVREKTEKTVLADYYQLELMEAKELLTTEMDLIQTVISDERKYSTSVESKAKRLEEELQSAKEEVSDLNRRVEMLVSEIECLKNEALESSERELELQVEIATLKSEVHKNRSRIAAAEAAEARALSTQSGLHVAVQQLAREAEAAKKEVETLKLELGFGITISVEEYESLVQKAMIVDEKVDLRSEVDGLKKEMEATNDEIRDLRSELADATKRAEMAENAKLAIEEQLRNWREKQRQRRAAKEALRQQSGKRSLGDERNSGYKPTLRSTSLQDGKIFSYIPLGKMLNMKY